MERVIISPLLADDLLSIIRIDFGLPYLGKKMRDGKKYFLLPLLFKCLLKLRVVFYKILAIIAGLFIRKGRTIYLAASIKDETNNS